MNKQEVIKGIKYRAAKDKSISAVDVEREDPGLYSAAISFFDDWSLALMTAGFKYGQSGKVRNWTNQLVIDEIKARYKNGLSLGYTATLAEDEALVGAARRHFSSWDAAVKAAGLDIEVYKYKLLDSSVQNWDRDRVLREIQAYAEAGGDLSAGIVRKKYSRLYSAATTYFGSWRAALDELGINYADIILRQKWTPNKLIAAIKDAHKKGADLSDRTISSLRSDWYGAAQTHFGSWPAALEAAGLNPEDVRRTTTWSREKIIEAATRAFEAGITITQMFESRILDKGTMLKHFSSTEDLAHTIGATGTDLAIENNLEPIMLAKEISAPELANRIGRTSVYVRHLMRAMYLPKIQDALLIADVLDCDVRVIWIIKKPPSK